jgi:putative transposase
MTAPAPPSYAGYRFPAEIISHDVWLYFRFPLSLRHVDEILAARGVAVSHETVRQWALKFGQAFANQIRRRLPRAGDKWHLDEVAVKIAGVKHWLWRAVDQDGMVLDILVQGRRDKRAAKRLLRKLLRKRCRPPRVLVTDKLASYAATKREVMPGVEHRQHKGWYGRCQDRSLGAAPQIWTSEPPRPRGSFLVRLRAISSSRPEYQRAPRAAAVNTGRRRRAAVLRGASTAPASARSGPVSPRKPSLRWLCQHSCPQV